MSPFKLVFLLFLLIFQAEFIFGVQASANRSLLNINCGPACDYRCSKADAHDRCIKYCNICCRKCSCVPPGTYGNKETCPCYNNMKNSKGGPKCP